MLDKKGFDLWAKEYDNTVNTCYLNKEYPEADIVFERIKTSKTAEDLRERLCQC